MDRSYCVYIVSSEDNKYIYIGVTNNIYRRMTEHKNFMRPNSYSARKKTTKLVYLECGDEFIPAAEREHQIKRWRREKKDYIISLINPEWKDLSEDWDLPILSDIEIEDWVKRYWGISEEDRREGGMYKE